MQWTPSRRRLKCGRTINHITLGEVPDEGQHLRKITRHRRETVIWKFVERIRLMCTSIFYEQFIQIQLWAFQNTQSKPKRHILQVSSIERHMTSTEDKCPRNHNDPNPTSPTSRISDASTKTEILENYLCKSAASNPNLKLQSMNRCRAVQQIKNLEPSVLTHPTLQAWNSCTNRNLSVTRPGGRPPFAPYSCHT